MSKHLTNLDITTVSFVDKGANGKKFHVIKRLSEEEIKKNQEAEAAAQKVGKQGTETAPTPPKSFNEAVSLADKEKKFSDAFWTLRNVIDNIFQNESITDKSTAIGTSIDEFKTYVLANLPIAKRDMGKTSGKISPEYINKIQDAVKVLNELSGCIETKDEGSITKMTDEEIKKQLEPLTEITKKVGELSDSVKKQDETIKSQDEIIKKQAETIKELSKFKEDVLKAGFSNQTIETPQPENSKSEFSAFDPGSAE